MNEARLRRLFQTAVSLSLAGCAHRIDPDGFATNLCVNGAFVPLADVTPSAPVDYVEFRTQVDDGIGYPPNALFETGASHGTACANAARPAACETALADLRSGAGWRPDLPNALRWGLHRYAVINRGDAVEPITSLDALASFLGPIDTAGEAALFASERGYRLSCDGANARRTATGFELRVQSGSDCGRDEGIDEHVLAVDGVGRVTVRETVRVQDGNPNCINGRRFEGLDLPRASARDTLGNYLARAAELEAASVPAFRRLARELRSLGAPEALVAAAERSARDEVRHARVMSRLARARGASVRAIHLPQFSLRSALEVARENAVEGCVRETFGALQATFQAERARDPEIARALKAISRDETRHAALAWEVAAWLEPRLTEAQRRSVARARRRAIATLRRELGAAPSGEVAWGAGVPGVAASRALLASVAAELWA